MSIENPGYLKEIFSGEYLKSKAYRKAVKLGLKYINRKLDIPAEFTLDNATDQPSVGLGYQKKLSGGGTGYVGVKYSSTGESRVVLGFKRNFITKPALPFRKNR